MFDSHGYCANIYTGAWLDEAICEHSSMRMQPDWVDEMFPWAGQGGYECRNKSGWQKAFGCYKAFIGAQLGATAVVRSLMSTVDEIATIASLGLTAIRETGAAGAGFLNRIFNKPTPVSGPCTADSGMDWMGGVKVEAACAPDYYDASYHTSKGNPIKSPKPINGQQSLNNSIQIKPTPPRRIAIQGENEFVIVDQTSENLFHGHVRPWSELSQDQQLALIRAGLTNRRGKILNKPK